MLPDLCTGWGPSPAAPAGAALREQVLAAVLNRLSANVLRLAGRASTPVRGVKYTRRQLLHGAHQYTSVHHHVASKDI